MPSIFDNIDLPLLPNLLAALRTAARADFCLGYFNLRGWQEVGPCLGSWPGGEEGCCRVLLDVPCAQEEELRAALQRSAGEGMLDNQTALRLKKRMLKAL